MSTEIITHNQVRPGDKITATFTYSRHADEYTVTGKARAGSLGHYVGHRLVTNAIRIERHLPDWRDAAVVRVAGRLYGLGENFAWRLLKPTDADELVWFNDYQLAALGEVEIVIDADGQVVES